MTAFIAHINSLPVIVHVALALFGAVVGGGAFGFIIGRIGERAHERIADASRLAVQIAEHRLLNKESV